MKIKLIAIGTKMPGWINEGFLHYLKRMPPKFPLSLKELTAVKRNKHTANQQAIEEETNRLFQATEPNHIRIILDKGGKALDTLALANQLNEWDNIGQPISILIGGHEGFSKDAKEKSDYCWSLSKLTFPHPLVRVIVAEQLYRAVSILNNHPYHR